MTLQELEVKLGGNYLTDVYHATWAIKQNNETTFTIVYKAEFGSPWYEGTAEACIAYAQGVADGVSEYIEDHMYDNAGDDA